ncbi:MAG: NAD-dependent epimerase/dehydratase family protein [Candidatus Amulumruptor sp.]
MLRVLLIGGSGFIGKHIAKKLYGIYDTTVADKHIDKTYFDCFPDIRRYELDLAAEQIPTDCPEPDFIINLASIVTASRDMDLFDSMITANLKILLNLYERFKETERLKLFIQFGSSEEYGLTESPYREDMREQPVSPYALVKQLTTNTTIMLYHNYGFPAMVVRPGNLFGTGQNPDKFIPYVLSQLKKEQPLKVTPCEQRRDFIHIDDFCEAIDIILANPAQCVGEIMNISSGTSIPLKDIIETLRQATGSTSSVQYGAIPYRKNEAMDLRCDTTKFDRLRKNHLLALRLRQMTK